MPVHLCRTHAACLLLATTLAGCVVAPYPYAYDSGPGGPAVYATVAPPMPYVETIPVAPYPGAIWIGGYWNWAQGRYAWAPGRWERPQPGHRWEPRQWRYDQGRWQQHGGYWRR